MNYSDKVERSWIRHNIEKVEKWREIIPEIPYIHFKPEWSVKIIPPFSLAVARFLIEYNGNYVSVYLDWYDQLGCVGQPYYEVYDGMDTSRYLLDETDKMMKYIELVLND